MSTDQNEEETIEELVESRKKLMQRRRAINEKIEAVEKSIEIFMDDLRVKVKPEKIADQICTRDLKSVASTTKAVLRSAEQPLRVQEVESVVLEFHDDVRDNYIAEILSRMYRNNEARRPEPQTYVAA